VDELNATWKKRLADPSPDALHTIKDQLAQIQDRLADAKSALQDEGLEEEPHRRDPDAG
jgi:hypothetical protein